MREIEEIECEALNTVKLQIGQHSNVPENWDAGGFLFDDSTEYVWMCQGSFFAIVCTRTGRVISACNFDEPVSCVVPLSSLSSPAAADSNSRFGHGQSPVSLPLILIGLDNKAQTSVKDSSGYLCILDCNIRCVLRKILMPAGVEQICVLDNGKSSPIPEISYDRLSQNPCGIVYVALKNFQHLLIDLRLDLFGQCDFPNLAEIDFTPPHHEENLAINKHAALNIMGPHMEATLGFDRQEFALLPPRKKKLTTAVANSSRLDCFLVACLGHLLIWKKNGCLEWISPPDFFEDEEATTISRLAFLEPTDDPSPFFYACVLSQSEDARPASPVLHMYTMLFRTKTNEEDGNFYLHLEREPAYKFTLDLDENDRVVSLKSVSREGPEKSCLLIGSEGSVILFDLNQWYQERMPGSLERCCNPNSLASKYVLKWEGPNGARNAIHEFSCVPSSLREFRSGNILNPPEEFSHPGSLAWSWVELDSSQLVFWQTRGVQRSFLNKLEQADTVLFHQPEAAVQRCLSIGLAPLACPSAGDSADLQRELLFSVCLENSMIKTLAKCAREWHDGSANHLYLLLLRWAVERTVAIKALADAASQPLLDHSGCGIGEAQIRTLHSCRKQLDCLAIVLGASPATAASRQYQQQRRHLVRASTYIEVLLWLHQVGLLPEQPPFSSSGCCSDPFFGETRKERTFVDDLVEEHLPGLRAQWESEAREGAGGSEGYAGGYPPPSFESLLRMYQSNNNGHANQELGIEDEIKLKHQVTLYLLMDLCPPGRFKQPDIFARSFALSPSIFQLVQAFWLLDAGDFQATSKLLLGTTLLDSDIKDWHHRRIMRTLLDHGQNQLAFEYANVRRPPISTIEEQEALIRLTVQFGQVRNAFRCRPPAHCGRLLRSFFQACKDEGKLLEVLYLCLSPEEEEAFIDFLEQDDSNSDLLALYLMQRPCHARKLKKNIFGNVRSSGNGEMQQLLRAFDATVPRIVMRFRECFEQDPATIMKASNEAAPYPESGQFKPLSHRDNRLRGSDPNFFKVLMSKARETSNPGRFVPFLSVPYAAVSPSEDFSDYRDVVYPRINKTRCHEQQQQQQQPPQTSPSYLKDMWALSSTPMIGRKNLQARSAAPSNPQSILKSRNLQTPNRSSLHKIRFNVEDKNPSEGQQQQDEDGPSLSQLSPIAPHLLSSDVSADFSPLIREPGKNESPPPASSRLSTGSSKAPIESSRLRFDIAAVDNILDSNSDLSSLVVHTDDQLDQKPIEEREEKTRYLDELSNVVENSDAQAAAGPSCKRSFGKVENILSSDSEYSFARHDSELNDKSKEERKETAKEEEEKTRYLDELSRVFENSDAQAAASPSCSSSGGPLLRRSCWSKRSFGKVENILSSDSEYSFARHDGELSDKSKEEGKETENQEEEKTRYLDEILFGKQDEKEMDSFHSANKSFANTEMTDDDSFEIPEIPSMEQDEPAATAGNKRSESPEEQDQDEDFTAKRQKLEEGLVEAGKKVEKKKKAGAKKKVEKKTEDNARVTRSMSKSESFEESPLSVTRASQSGGESLAVEQATRMRTRRSVSVLKQAEETTQLSVKTPQDSLTVGDEVPRKRPLRSTWVQKEAQDGAVLLTDQVPRIRIARAVSVQKEAEDSTISVPRMRTRRAVSVQKEAEDSAVSVPRMRTRRAVSVQKEAEDSAVSVPRMRTRRAVSVQKEAEDSAVLVADHALRKRTRRAVSVQKEEDSLEGAKNTSVSGKKGKASSVERADKITLPPSLGENRRQTRGSSVPAESNFGTEPKRQKRATSADVETKKTSSIPRRVTRGAIAKGLIEPIAEEPEYEFSQPKKTNQNIRAAIPKVSQNFVFSPPDTSTKRAGSRRR